MNLVCCQFDIVWEDKPANHAKVRRLLEAAQPKAGSLVLLPEMFATGFSMNVAGIRDDQTEETQRFLAEAARDYGIFLIGGLVTADAHGRGRNEATVFSPTGEPIARYQKIHPFTFSDEAMHYVGGSDINTFACSDFVVSPFICYDLRFPEVFRRAVRRGAQLFTVIANWPAAREHHWVTLLQSRAIENQAYVAGVNRCGKDPSHHYSGRSLIISPRGEVLADAGDREIPIQAEIDLASLMTYRREFPALQDMHPQFLDLV